MLLLWNPATNSLRLYWYEGGKLLGSWYDDNYASWSYSLYDRSSIWPDGFAAIKSAYRDFKVLAEEYE